MKTLSAVVAGLALGLSLSAPARADMIVVWPDLALVGEPTVVSGAPTEATFVLTNTGSDAEEVSEPHLVLVDDGIRIPLRITSYEIDGAARSRFDVFTLAPGASVRVHVAFSDLRDRGERSWQLAMSFRGMRAPATVTMTRG